MIRTSENNYVIADGSIRSGKTIACIIGFLTWSQEMFSGESFILAGKTMGALKKNVVRPMLQMLEAWGWPYEYIRSGTDARLEIGTNTYYLYGANTEAAQDLPKLTIYFYRCYATRYRKLTADLGLTLRGSERPGLTGKRFFCISVSTSGGEMSFRRK